MIEHVFLQLEPHFGQILVSANDTAKYAFLNASVVPDRLPEHGPLMGIASCLEASEHELNFVVACDIPTIDIAFVKKLLRLATNCTTKSPGNHVDAAPPGFVDCVVPVNAQGQIEPLFAVYRKSALDAIWATLDAGECAVRNAFTRCRTRYIELGNADKFENVNTNEEYQQLLERPLFAIDRRPNLTRGAEDTGLRATRHTHHAHLLSCS